MNTQSNKYLIDALDIVLGWNISDELLPLALVSQAQLMAGFDAESGDDAEAEYGWLSPESISGTCVDADGAGGRSCPGQTDTPPPSAVPLPAALPLMLSGLGVLGFASRRRKATEV